MRNHVELRKVLPKGRGVSFDRLTRTEALLAAFGDDAWALLDAFGVELLEPSELDLTPGCMERARREVRRRWPTSLLEDNRIGAEVPVALSLETVRGGQRSPTLGPITTPLHASYTCGKAGGDRLCSPRCIPLGTKTH